MNNDNLLPKIVTDLLSEVSNKKNPVHIRQNYRNAISNIAEACRVAVEKFDKENFTRK